MKHSAGEYVRGGVHSNTVEGGAEYDFRDNTREKLGFNETERTLRAIHGAERKRLIYRQPHLADYRKAAERFLRWRRKNHKGLKP